MKRASIIFAVHYVNLGSQQNHAFDVDDDGGTLFYLERHEDEGVRGHLARDSVERLVKATKRLCEVKKPPTEPMTFIALDVPGCRLFMSEQEWKARVPELMKLIPKLQEEACRGACRVPDHFMED